MVECSPLLRTLFAIVAAAGLACAAAPASTPTRTIPAGVSVGGIAVGGLSAEPARAVVERAFGRPVRVRSSDATVSVRPEALGAGLSVDTAVGAALAATPHSRIALPVRSSHAKIAAVVASLAKRYDRPAIDATVVGATTSRPRFSPARAGLAVDAKTMRTALAQVLQDGRRGATHTARRTPSRRSARLRRSAR